jgi:hypothetical protein
MAFLMPFKTTMLSSVIGKIDTRMLSHSGELCGFGQFRCASACPFGRWAGDLWPVRPPKTASMETAVECSKARRLQAFLQVVKRGPGRTDCVAGDAVLFAPVSMRFPCKQGIFQGIFQNLARKGFLFRRKSLRRRRFAHNSLIKITGKEFSKTGKL